MKRSVLWIFCLAALALTLGLKAALQDSFATCEPLPLNGQTALVFFTLSQGCDCQMTVVHAAEAQLAYWVSPILLLHVDFDRCPDLARKLGLARAPALVLVNADGQVVWKQDEGLSDESPLNLEQAKVRIDALSISPYNK